MRTLSQIDADIAATEVKLSALHAERRQSIRAQTDRLVSMFEAGKSFAEISAETGIPYSGVQGRLWRAGRTLGGRMAMRGKLRDVGAHDADAVST